MHISKIHRKASYTLKAHSMEHSVCPGTLTYLNFHEKLFLSTIRRIMMLRLRSARMTLRFKLLNCLKCMKANLSSKTKVADK